MKLTKKLLAALLAALMLLTAMPFAFAAPVTYTIENGVLTVSGSGIMPSYQYQDRPWVGAQDEADVLNATSIVIKGFSTIGAYAFQNLTKVTSVTIPANVTSIDVYAFNGCTSLQNVTLPAGLTVIDRGTFLSCASLTNITIPDKVETICSYAFSNTGLTEIFLPMSVKTLEKYAFSGCNALKKITIKNTKCNIVSGSLPPATPAGYNEEPVTIYAVYKSTGDNYAIANNYAYVRIVDEDKPAYETPDTVQEVIAVSKEELKDTSFGAFIRRMIELLTGVFKKNEKEPVEVPFSITGPGADLGGFIMKSPLAEYILRIRNFFSSSLGGALADVL